MNIAGLRKCVITFCITLLLHFIFYTVAVAQNLDTSPAKGNSHPKMSSYLQKLEKEYKEGMGVQRMVAQGMNITSYDPDKVTVYLMSEPGTNVDETALLNLGAEITKRSGNVIRAQVPVDMLTAVADTVEGVSFMKTPDKLIPVAVTSEGVDLTGTDKYHNAGYTGSDVKVAVIDVGFDGLSSAISSGELSDNPDKLKRIDCTGACVPSDFSSEEDSHGTAVAEIVYDMAPDATLYLIKVKYIDDLRDAKNYAVNNGIRIINHSLVVPNTNFYDGECWSIGGLPNAACTANDAYANNILWVNAAGNEAQRHYEAVFTDPDDDGWHNVLGSDETIKISVDPNHTTINVYLTWDAWPTTNQNYDLYLLDDSLDPLNPFASSKNPAGGQPIEEIYINNVPPGDYYLTIRQESASSNHLFEVYSIYHDLSPAMASSSLLGPADAVGAMAVGAINYNKWATGPQEPYSSRGPTNDGRIKPDIMGPDNVTNYTSLNFGGRFTGTSASSPHVSGAAALILDKFPGISVDDLWNTLTSTAIYMDYMQDPNIYGSGLLNLDINAAIPSSISVTSSGGGGGGCFIATAAYGSYTAPCVQILREMRDRFLIKSSIGKSFVNLYCKYSPTMADFIANHDNVKILVRLSLLPLVGISWLALKMGPMFTITLMVLFVFGLIRLFSNKTLSNRKTI